MIKVHLNNLAIILGTACNLQCKHCLGGNPKKEIKIQERIIDDLIPNVSGIDELSFIGYEDTFYISEMKMIIDKLLVSEISINRFTIFTNSVEYNQELVDFYRHYKEYVLRPDRIAIHFSNDTFHYNNGFNAKDCDTNIQRYINELNLNNYQIQQFTNDIANLDISTLMIQGRAKKLNYNDLSGISKIKIPIVTQTNFPVKFREKCEGMQNTCCNGKCILNCIVDEIVLTPNGFIFINDGMAFNAIDTDNYSQAIGHIGNTSLYDMVQRKNKEYDKTKNKTLSVRFRDETALDWCIQKLVYDYLINVNLVFQYVSESNIEKYKKVITKIEKEITIQKHKFDLEEYANCIYGMLKLDFEALRDIADWCFMPIMKTLFLAQLDMYKKNSPFRRENFNRIVGIRYDNFIKLWDYYYKCDFEQYKRIALKIINDKNTNE